jgi:hypothetical protein
MFSVPEISKNFVELFAIQKKSELEKFCSDLVITQEELVQLICWSPIINYTHNSRHEEYHPSDAELTENDLEAVRTKDPIVRARKLPKFVNKLGNMFEVRKRLSAHLFLGAGTSRWQLFYFSLRDVSDKPPFHWKHGPHIHFINDLWPHYHPEQLDNLLFSNRRTQIGDSIHIRYKPLKMRR